MMGEGPAYAGAQTEVMRMEERRNGGREGADGLPCPVFRASEKGQWRARLEEEIAALEGEGGEDGAL
jgi:hypothetical protein